jgi:predicted nucleotidyltransferase
MRLTSEEVAAIKNSISAFDPNARIYLFGSRVRDDARGGDIDLLIFSEKITYDDRRSIKIKLYDALGEQKIDLVLAKDASEAFIEIATKEGVLL